MAPRAVPIRAGEDHERRYPGADKLATECVVNLLRTEDLISAELGRRFRAAGLSVATFNVLMILEGAGCALGPHEIGDALLVTRGTVTGLLDSLETRGLIARGPHPQDRRMLHVTLTARGRRLLARLLPQHFPAEADLVSVLSDREKETLIRLLGKLQAHLEA
jgi:DNA-binding MarR family transcriptional regulator